MSARRGCATLLALVAAAALLALAERSPAAAGAVPGPCATAPQAGDQELSISAGGVVRTALLHIPPGVPAGQGLPLLIALHGAMQNASFFAPYSGYSAIADVERFAVLYPNALNGHWTISAAARAEGRPDDVAFISQLLDVVGGQQCLDPRRIYATGVSNGGGMAARLGCDLSGRIAAIAPVAGGYGSLPPCEPSNPVSVLEVHGTNDGVVPYADGAGAVRGYLHAWLVRDRCSAAQTVRHLAPQVRAYAWTHCARGVAVEHLEVFGGTHQLPGSLPSDTGPASTFSAPWAVWEFVRGHRLAAGAG